MPFRLPGLLAKQAHGLIGQHAAGNRNRREGRFCGDLGAGNHDLGDLGRQLVDRCRIDQAAEMAPDNRAHAHGTGFAGGVERRAPERRAAMLREPMPDRLHLAMGGRIIEPPTHVGAARNNLSIAHDHRAERKICVARLVDRHAHEALVIRRCGRGCGNAQRWARKTECYSTSRGQQAPPLGMTQQGGVLSAHGLGPRDLIDVFPRDDAGCASLTSIAMCVRLNSSTNSESTLRTTSAVASQCSRSRSSAASMHVAAHEPASRGLVTHRAGCKGTLKLIYFLWLRYAACK